MRLPLFVRFWSVLAAAVALGLAANVIYAHEGRDLGEYRFTVGFSAEPAFEGIKNGVSLRVVHVHTQGAEEEIEPVEGLEETLQVEVTHVASGASRIMNLRTIFQDPGHYTADLIPTAPGVYQFRFFGAVEGIEVNETFVSRGGGGGFDDIQSAAELQFPEQLPEAREVEAAVRGAQSTAQDAQEVALSANHSSSNARTLAIVGIVLGAVGIVSGVGGVMVGMRRR